MLVMAAMLALMMSLGGAGAAFADPDCDQVRDNNKNCVVDGPGNSEGSNGQAVDKNPQVKDTFKNRPQPE